MSVNPLKSIIYHHRTRGAAVEAVHIRGIINALRADGHSVELISPPNSDPYKETGTKIKSDPVGGQVPAWQVSFKNTLFQLAEIGYNVYALVRLLIAIVKKKPDFIYERYALFLFATVVVGRLSKIPVILEINDSAAVERVRPVIFKGLANSIERFVFANADGLVFISGAFRDLVMPNIASRRPIIITPNAANLVDFRRDDRVRAASRLSLGLNGKIVCGYVGAFVHWHGIDTFVREMAPFLKLNHDIALLLVGDGRLFEQIKAFVAAEGLTEKVVLTGRVPHSQVGSLIAAMDFSVLPNSNLYGSPVKLFELMAASVPVLVPDYEPCTEIVENGVNGWTFPRGDFQACIAATVQICSKPDLITLAGQNAERTIEQQHQWKNNSDKVLALVSSLEQLGSI
jgi:glycosyltransferase involved in cell wall biosynthesis